MNNIINSAETRQELINRVEVLNKVKKLLLIPDMAFTTMNGVANYYEVSIHAIQSILRRHREEIEKDGLQILNKKDFLENFLNGQIDSSKTTSTKATITVTYQDGQTHTFSNRGTIMFPKRAILRIGMLLTNSKVAEEVRTQLLNIQEKTSSEIKVEDIEKEIQLLGNVLANAFIENDIEAFAKASLQLNKFNNRHKDKAIEDLKKLNSELNSKVIELTENLKIVQERNNVLVNGMTTVSSAQVNGEVLYSMIVRLKEKRGFKSTHLCFKEFYTLLKNKHDIYLSSRVYSNVDRDPDKPMYAYLTDEEWPKALQMATALCHRFNVEIDDLLARLNN